jgi:di/tricarboxylate transporter
MVAIGVVYLVLVSRWLLPKRAGEEQSIDKYRLSDYLAEFRVGKASPVVGKNWGEMDRGKVRDVDLIKIIRDEKATWRATATKIREGDLLLLHGNADQLLRLRDEFRLEGRADEAISDQKMSSEDVRLVEALIPPRSLLEGRSLKTLDFARRYRCIALALQRRGTILRSRLADIRLEAGDTLLIQCETREVQRMMRSRDLVVTNELTELNLRRDKVLMAVGMVAMVVVLAALGIVPILTAAIIGAVGMVLGRCITIEEAYEAIDWKVVFLLGGILPLGLALGESGTAEMLAETVMGPLVAFGPLVVLAALYITTAVLTETMSNNAAAVLLAPIALSLAGLLSVDPRPFLIAITFAASTSFATPIGYQTNTMVYAPGGYRFFDFARIGIPLNLIFWATAVILIPVLWPF